MKKIRVIIIGMIAIVILLILGISNKDSISKYFHNKEWEIAETVGTVMTSNYFEVDGTSSHLLVIGNNYITGYANNSKEIFDESVLLKNAVSSTNGDFCIVGEKDGTKVYLISGTTKLWESEIQGNILDVSVNKNGYSSIIYKQTGYKSLIKVLNPDGEELFTNYLASTYAIDSELSTDNKTLAIAEINAEGIMVQSSIKLVDMTNVTDENVTKISLENDILITNIEYNDKNQLLVLTDVGASIVDNGALIPIVEKFDNNTTFATIENKSEVIEVVKVENGLFDVSYKVNIYHYKEGNVSVNSYPIKYLPSIVTSEGKYIALLLDSELIVINTNGRLIKHSEVIGNVKNIRFFENGNSLVLIYRDKIDFLKI